MKTIQNIPFSRSEHLFIGVCLILGGLASIGFSKGWFPAAWSDVVFSLPMFFCLLGWYICLCRGYMVSGVILALSGGYILFLKQFDDGSDDVVYEMIREYWPGILILLGIVLIIRLRKSRIRANKGLPLVKKQMNANGEIDYKYIFGEGEHIFLEPEFKGGRIRTIVGGVSLDLRHTNLAPGETYLQLTAFLGGVYLDIPEEWVVEIRSKSMFCGFVDKRNSLQCNKILGRKLIIEVQFVLSGGEIR